jgi:hypothetical protein
MIFFSAICFFAGHDWSYSESDDSYSVLKKCNRCGLTFSTSSYNP